MMFKEIHECIGHLRYEITAKPKRIAFVIHQREASYRKATKGTEERDEPRYCIARMFLGRLWHWISFEDISDLYRYVRIAKPGCKFSPYPPGIRRADFKFWKTVQDLGIKRRDLKVREGSTAIRQTSLVLEETQLIPVSV